MPEETAQAEPEAAPEITEAPEAAVTPSATPEPEETASDTVLPELSFDENTVLTAPVSGTYRRNPDTLQHGQNSVFPPRWESINAAPAIAMAADVGTPVAAVARSQVLSVEEDPQTGVTVTMGYGQRLSGGIRTAGRW